jgi:hypothetical protein
LLRALCFIALFVFGVPVFQAHLRAASPEAPIVVDGLGKGTIPLVGPWQFHTGDDPAWADPVFDDSHWEQLRGNAPWGMQGHAGYTGFAWYRLHLILNPSPDSQPDFAILLSGVEDAYELYWNGVLIGHNGKLAPNEVWYIDQPVQTFGLGPAHRGVLSVRVWNALLSSDETGQHGGLVNAPVLGGPEAILHLKAQHDYDWLRSQQLNFGLKLIYFVVAILSLIAWVKDRRQWYLLWITIYAIFPVINLFLYEMHFPLPNRVLELSDGEQTIQNVAVWLLLFWLLDLRVDRRMRRYLIMAVAGFSAKFLEWLLATLLDVRWVVASLMLSVFCTSLPFGMVRSALRQHRRLDHSRWLLAIFACLQQVVYILELYRSFLADTDLAFDKLFVALFAVNGNPVNVTTLVKTLLLLSIVYAVYRYSVENRKRQTLLEHEFKSARELQQVLIPETIPSVPGFALTSAYRPAQEVGGDFFQIIPLAGESTLIVLGDVSGKGLKAAMAVSLIVGVINTVAEEWPSPAEMLAQLNRRLCGRLQGGFATCLVLRLSPTGVCTIASAGHPGPFLNGEEVSLPGSLPLGLTHLSSYDETPLSLNINDSLSLFTDGLLEARNQAGELYGYERLKTLFAAKPTSAEATEAAVTFGQEDDITVLTLTRLAAGEESTTQYTAPILSPA